MRRKRKLFGRSGNITRQDLFGRAFLRYTYLLFHKFDASCIPIIGMGRVQDALNMQETRKNVLSNLIQRRLCT
jgi:hypothetical protein